MWPPRALCPGGRARRPLLVPPLGLGGAGLGGGYGPVGLQQGIDTVRAALDAGLRVIDTSPLYGDSEYKIGLAVRPSERDGLVLSTKVGTHPQLRGYTAELARRSLEQSLRLLRTDRVEVCLIHDPDGAGFEVALGPGGALEWLLQAKERGLVAAVGLGVREHALHQRLIATGCADVVLTYRDYTLAERSAALGVLLPAQRAGVGVMLGSPLAAGLLAGPEPEALARAGRWSGPAAYLARAQRAWVWAREHGLDLTRLALQFALGHPAVCAVLVGASSPAEVAADVAALADPLPGSVWAELEGALA